MPMLNGLAGLATAGLVLSAVAPAHAQQATASPSALGASPPATPAPSPPSTSVTLPAEVRPQNAPSRTTDLHPTPVQPKPRDAKIQFEADPLGDGSILAVALGFAGTMELILSTGEIRPQQIDPNFDTHNLLSFDQAAISQTIDPNANTYSNVGLAAAFAFAALDPILSGFRDGREAALVDAVMYAEAVSVTLGLTDLAKVAVRRPRPIAYIDRRNFIAQGGAAANYDNTSTDSALSFFSGHAADTASIAAVATYLAFARAPNTARPWITLAGGILLTSFVSYERVRAGAHFPTDVVAGSLAGGGVGLLVAHLHRADTAQQRPIWVGFRPTNGGGRGGSMSLGGQF
jgi:undecaprenyl-diphosphatase